MADSLVIVVTGCSRGVGKGMTELLAQQRLEQPITIYATSRVGTNTGVQVAAPNHIRYEKLDITNPASIQSFFDRLLKEQIVADVLINNAAVSNDYRETPEFAIQTITNNYGGTRDMCKAFLAQSNMRPGSRIVNVTSGYNALSSYGLDLQHRFREATTIEDVDALATTYLNSVNNGPAAQQQGGWGSGARSYKVSKALISTLAIVLAQQFPNVLVNCCCPGWVNTDMGRQGPGTPPKTPEEGARTAVRLAIGDLGPSGDEDGGLGRNSAKVSGYFFENMTIIDRGWGKAKLWQEL